MARKYTRRKPVTPYVPTEEQKERMVKAVKLYEELGTLQAVADKMGMTRERVRQIIRKGEKYGLLSYKLTRVRKIETLARRISKDKLIDSIFFSKNKDEICQKLTIDVYEYERLINHYRINLPSLVTNARYIRCRLEYEKLVEHLGHHPSATEMQSKNTWRALYARIERLWGGIEEFRKEYRIQKPKHALHPNTITAFAEAKAKKRVEREKRLEKILMIIEKHRIVTITDICTLTGLKYPTAALYLQILLKEKKIKTFPSLHRYNFYTSVNLSN